ncbi:GatB/YqeY domain-containing protein [Salinarimonas sp.]|uniref:GatB/YqeY domain-containing protein n=1 Tax=Salinarimonas sp. TaxID=2766526 RepID=UPI0032D93E34
MTLRERFTQELKDAMKAGDKRKLGTVRMIQAAVKDKDIESRGAGREQASDEEILALLQKMIKQRQESAQVYAENGREELAQQEREEAEIVQSFLPKQLDEAETRAAIQAAIAETGAASMKDMGKVIGKLRADHAGRMDFAKASALVKEMLPKG